VEAMNEVILHEYGFSGNTQDYTGAKNSYINKVIENKMGNPIMLCILYLLVARRLNVPLIGINSPRHFILAYLSNTNAHDAGRKEMDYVDFLVDPFFNGTTYSVSDFKKALKDEFYEIYRDALPASNITIIKRVLNNVIYAIHQEGRENRAKNLLKIAESL
jgi:regulator of sirC expression with transglutaminase-like and TPR domain